MSRTFSKTMKASALAILGLGAIAYSSGASACGNDALTHQASLQSDSDAASLFHQAAIAGPRSIVGMWSFTMSPSEGPGDFGYQQWHSDGTELMNSGGRSPATENFCMGVWQQTGANRYHLNHQALSYDLTGALNAKVTIKEDVTVDSSGNGYSGSFTLDVFSPTGAAIAHQSGQVTATRVLPN